jgi:hypothetical protein
MLHSGLSSMFVLKTEKNMAAQEAEVKGRNQKINCLKPEKSIT